MNSAAGFDIRWDGNWRGPDKWNSHSAYRTVHPRKLAGMKQNKPKYNSKKRDR